MDQMGESRLIRQLFIFLIFINRSAKSARPAETSAGFIMYSFKAGQEGSK
jgi:hypothetical protein